MGEAQVAPGVDVSDLPYVQDPQNMLLTSEPAQLADVAKSYKQLIPGTRNIIQLCSKDVPSRPGNHPKAIPEYNQRF